MPQADSSVRAGSGQVPAAAVPTLRLAMTLRLAIGLLGAEALGLLVVVIGLLVADLQASGPSLRGGVLVTLYAAILTAVLAGLSWALHRRRAWARGPAVVLQLLLLPIGYYMITGGQAWLGIPVMIIGLVGAATLLAPAARAALGVR
jgi:hypothetical protein